MLMVVMLLCGFSSTAGSSEPKVMPLFHSPVPVGFF